MAVTMDRKRLAIALSRIPDHPVPKSALEQVRTPGDIAADVLLVAHGEDDIGGRRVVDLGCGTGVFAIGAALLGAARVIGVDVDEAAVAAAGAAASAAGVADQVALWCGDVGEATRERALELLGGAPDTVVMNPPFGADLQSRARGGDRAFLEVAFALAPVVYSLHAANTERFLVAFARDEGFQVGKAGEFAFPLPGRFAHHRDLMRTLPVGLYRFSRA